MMAQPLQTPWPTPVRPAGDPVSSLRGALHVAISAMLQAQAAMSGGFDRTSGLPVSLPRALTALDIAIPAVQKALER